MNTTNVKDPDYVYPFHASTDPGYYHSRPPLPTPEEAVPGSDQLVSLVNERYRSSPLHPDLDGDYLTNTLLVSDKSISFQDAESDSANTLPPGLSDLIRDIDSLSKPLTQFQKLVLSQQLTRLSFSLQTGCLYPELAEVQSSPPSVSPPPPHLAPRSSPICTPVVEGAHVIARVSTPPHTRSDWVGPGHTGGDQKRPNQIKIMQSPNSPLSMTSPCIQFDSRNVSDEALYVNTTSSATCSGPAPPLPPRDANQSTYHNVRTPLKKNAKPNY